VFIELIFDLGMLDLLKSVSRKRWTVCILCLGMILEMEDPDGSDTGDVVA
jgi:hypothetical protein